MRTVLGEDAGRLEDGTTVELADGVYLIEDEMYVWLVLEEDGEAPQVLEFVMVIGAELSEALSQEELAEVGERMREMAPDVVSWQGEARPFEPEDLAPFLHAAEERGYIAPWRGRSIGQDHDAGSGTGTSPRTHAARRALRRWAAC